MRKIFVITAMVAVPAAVLSLPVPALCGERPAATVPAKDMPKCPQCGRLHPAGWEHCPVCKGAHPPGLPCPVCPPDGFVKCANPECGTFHPKGQKCPNCSRPKAPLRSVTCPVCSRAFNGPLPFNRNDKGGLDRDFCRHSLGRDVVEALVWTCPRCGHSDWCPELRGGREEPGRFGDKVTPEYAAAVIKEVKPLAVALLTEELGRVSGRLRGMVEDLEQSDIPDWIKYRLAVKCAEIRGEKPDVLAKLALEGSYACRRAASRAVELPALGQVIARTEATMLRRGAGDEDPRTVVRTCAEMLKQPAGAEGAPSPVERFYLYLRIAVSWDRLGDSELALEALEQAKAALQPAGEPAALKPLLDIADQRRELITRGKEFRAVAVTAMRRAFVEQNAYPAGAVVPTAYLLGELYRRQGDCARAGAWLTLSAKVAGAGHPLSRTVAETMQLPSMKNAGVDVEEEAVAVALLAKLTGRKPEEFLGPPDEGDGGGTGVVPAAAPLTCSEALETLGAAVRAYAGKHRRAPTSLEELLTGGFIGEKAAAGFKCPECGVELRYRQPKDLDDAEAVMIWHPAGGKCRQLIMYADGKVREKK